MKKALFFLVYLFAGFMLRGQITFERTYGGAADDFGTSGLQTNDGGYVLVGNTLSYGHGGSDVYLVKTNEFGDILWTKTYGGTGDDLGYSVKQTIDNGFIITGTTNGFGSGAYDVFLIRTDSIGDTLWTKTYGGTNDEEGYDVIKTSDNGFAIIGYTRSFSTVFSSVYLIRTDENGDTLWTKSYERLYANGANDFAETSDGGFIIVSTSKNSSTADLDKIWLIKTNNIGDTLWTKLFTSVNCDLIGSSVELTNDNGYIIAGAIVDSSGLVNINIIKTNSNGDIQWSKRLLDGVEERAICIRRTNDNNYILTGIKATSLKKIKKEFTKDHLLTELYNTNNKTNSAKWTNANLYLIKINITGDTIWTKIFGGDNNSTGRIVSQTNDNGYIIAGYTKSLVNNNDGYLIKTDANGHVVGINENEKPNNTINVSPNPFTTSAQITFNQTYKTIALEVYDIEGKLLLQNRYTNCNQIELRRGNLSEGLYFLKITIDGNKVETRKIVVSY